MNGILWLRRNSRRETVVVIACVAAVALLLIAGFVALGLVHAYRDTMASGRTRAANLALLLEEQTRRTVQAIDFSLLSIVDTLRETPETRRHDPAMTARMRARLTELPYVRAFFVIGADGFLIQDTDSNTPDVSLADREYFRVHRENANARLYIGQPLKSRSVGEPWFLSMSRRITLGDGRFYGVAVAALEPKYFARFYEDIVVGKGGSLALIHETGIVIARYPEHERGVGLSLAGAPLFARHLNVADSGTFEEASKVDGVDRVFGYRRLSPLPLVFAAGLSKAALLADWWEKLYVSAAATVACILTLSVGGLMLVRRRANALLSTERLQQIEKTEALGQMTSSVAHDFNNFLTVIGGNLDLVARRTAPDDPSSEKLARASDAVRRAGRLVSQLLAFARNEPLVSTRENLAELIGSLSELLNQAARPCELHLILPADVWSCMVNAGEFERAILNLVVNARDASAPGSRIEVSLSNASVARRELVLWPDLALGDYVACHVYDEGAGMSPEVARRAFEPFFTTKAEGSGTGLGLSQVFGFARKSGGGVHIESEIGNGTIVTLLLPRAAEAAVAIADQPGPLFRQEASRLRDSALAGMVRTD